MLNAEWQANRGIIKGRGDKQDKFKPNLELRKKIDGINEQSERANK